MYLNNKGWGLQELMVGLGILFFSLLLIVILINKNFKELENTLNQNKTESESNQNRIVEDETYDSYKEIENKMITAAKEYNNDVYGSALQEGDNLTVTVKSLVRAHYLDNITDIKDDNITCSGYVTFIKKGVNVTYSPYLKCDNKYKTKGYLERLDD